MSSARELPAFVMDCGSAITKAGLADTDPPKMMETVVGYPKRTGVQGWQDYYVGDAGDSKRGALVNKYPVEYGVVSQWDEMEKVWRYLFEDSFRLVPGGDMIEETDMHSVMITEPTGNPKENRERTTEIMFETFEVPNMFMANDLVMALYYSGRTTGLSVDCGDSKVQSVAVFEGYSLPHTYQREGEAGWAHTDHLVRILGESRINLHTTAERRIAKEIKETLCYVSLDYDNEVDNFTGITTMSAVRATQLLST